MKKLDLEQMEKVNGGEWSSRRCNRVWRRATGRPGTPKGMGLISKWVVNC